MVSSVQYPINCDENYAFIIQTSFRRPWAPLTLIQRRYLLGAVVHKFIPSSDQNMMATLHDTREVTLCAGHMLDQTGTYTLSRQRSVPLESHSSWQLRADLRQKLRMAPTGNMLTPH